MKFLKKLRKRWQGWRFQKQNPVVAERHAYLKTAVQLGKQQEGRYRDD